MSFKLTFVSSNREEIFKDEILNAKLKELLDISPCIHADQMFDAPFNFGEKVNDYYKYCNNTAETGYRVRKHISFVDRDICYAFGNALVRYNENEIKIEFYDFDLLKMQVIDGETNFEQIGIEEAIKEWIESQPRGCRTKGAHKG